MFLLSFTLDSLNIFVFCFLFLFFGCILYSPEHDTTILHAFLIFCIGTGMVSADIGRIRTGTGICFLFLLFLQQEYRFDEETRRLFRASIGKGEGLLGGYYPAEHSFTGDVGTRSILLRSDQCELIVFHFILLKSCLDCHSRVVLCYSMLFVRSRSCYSSILPYAPTTTPSLLSAKPNKSPPC